MGALIIDIASPTEQRETAIEVNAEELILRLRSLTEGCSIEVIRLAIESMVDEIADAVGTISSE
jgi:hypothetical protein